MIALVRRTLNRIRNWLTRLDDAHDCWDDGTSD